MSTVEAPQDQRGLQLSESGSPPATPLAPQDHKDLLQRPAPSAGRILLGGLGRFDWDTGRTGKILLGEYYWEDSNGRILLGGFYREDSTGRILLGGCPQTRSNS